MISDALVDGPADALVDGPADALGDGPATVMVRGPADAPADVPVIALTALLNAMRASRRDSSIARLR